MNTAFLKVKLLDDFLKETHKHRQKLLEELIVKTNNPVVRMRRFRMLSQLADYESITIKKIMLLDPCVTDVIYHNYCQEILTVVNRSG
jgi:predicted PolB exonuclease-like 3'-5' exonuclease